MTYDIKRELDKRAKDAKSAGTALQGRWEVVSNCESVSAAAGTRGVWSDIGTVGTGVAADATPVYGTNSVKQIMTTTSLATGMRFTYTTSHNWKNYNYLGFWLQDATNTLASGKIGVKIYDSADNVLLTDIASVACPVAATFHYQLIDLADMTSKTDVKKIDIYVYAEIGTDTLYIDNLEVFEFRAGKGPLKVGHVEKHRVGGTGFAAGDVVSIDITGAVSLGAANGTLNHGVAITAGTANTTQEGTNEAWILTEGIAILKANEALTLGDGLSLADATTTAQLVDDGGGSAPLEAFGYAMADVATQYDPVVAYICGSKKFAVTA